LLLGACAADGGDHVALREVVDRAAISLGDAVTLAETNPQYGAGITARMDVTTEQYAVGAIATETRREVRYDFHGNVVSVVEAGAAGAGCQTQISLAEALARAEAERGGHTVPVTPGDDGPCLREIQVLVGTTLWEVKLGPDGALVEKELSDEDL